MSTSIKRLKQNGSEFVPITLAEAVVVNGNYIWNSDTITTLDAVLKTLFGLNSNLNSLVETLNTLIASKQDTLIPGEGIAINVVDGKTVISSTTSLYKIVSSLPVASAECENKIYLVGGTEGLMVEYICVKGDSGYYFELLGLIQVLNDIDLSGYVTTTQFNQAISTVTTKVTELEQELDNATTSLQGSMLSAENITTSTGKVVSVDYNIPADLYDIAVADITTDYIS